MMDTMNLARLEQLVAAYGADPRRWPSAERGPALALIERSMEARAYVAEARRLDHALDATIAPADPAAIARLTARIHDDLPERRRARSGGSWMTFLWNAVAPTWSRGAALASVAALGILLGLSSDPSAFGADPVFDGTVSTSDTSIMGVFSSWSE